MMKQAVTIKGIDMRRCPTGFDNLVQYSAQALGILRSSRPNIRKITATLRYLRQHFAPILTFCLAAQPDRIVPITVVWVNAPAPIAHAG